MRLIATSGTKEGAATGGRLALMDQDSAYRSVERSDGSVDTTFSFPLYGTAEVDFAAVGATVPGDPRIADPLQPGVLVIERPGAASPTAAPPGLGGQPSRRSSVRRRLHRAAGAAGEGRWLRGHAGEAGCGLPRSPAATSARSRRPDRAEPADATAGEIGDLTRRSRDGGAGNRTLVRVSFRNRVYVRRLGFLPSPRGGAEPTSPWPSS